MQTRANEMSGFAIQGHAQKFTSSMAAEYTLVISVPFINEEARPSDGLLQNLLVVAMLHYLEAYSATQGRILEVVRDERD